MNPQTSAHLDLTYITPVVVADGNGIFINDQANIPTLVFFQVRSQTQEKVEADVVAAVRMNGIADLEQLQKSIEETIRKHRDREK